MTNELQHANNLAFGPAQQATPSMADVIGPRTRMTLGFGAILLGGLALTACNTEHSTAYAESEAVQTGEPLATVTNEVVTVSANAETETTSDHCASCEVDCAACNEFESPSYAYSPFTIGILNDTAFDIVTFKDVTGSHRLPADTLEAIAESVTASIGTVGFEGEMEYLPHWAADDAHRHCGVDHLYVDVWLSHEPSRWGFSLWSGCGEDDQFAWDEVEIPDEDAPMLDMIEPLADGIAGALGTATTSGCFRREC